MKQMLDHASLGIDLQFAEAQDHNDGAPISVGSALITSQNRLISEGSDHISGAPISTTLEAISLPHYCANSLVRYRISTLIR